MSFQLDHAATLVALVDEGSFERTARSLHVTPSAVSQRIHAMEEAIGSVLVQRTTPVVPTQAGRVALRYARQLLLVSADATRALRLDGGRPAVEHGGGEDGEAASSAPLTIPIAVNGDSLATWFLGALAGARDRIDAVYDIRREDEELATRLLRRGEVMAAITTTAKPVQGCTSTALGMMRYRAVSSPDFCERWRRDPGDEPAGAASDTASGWPLRLPSPMVNFDRSDTLQQRYLDSVLHRRAHPPSHYVPAAQDFGDAIVLGLGWGLLPDQQADAWLRTGRLVELMPGSSVRVPLYWQRWKLPSDALEMLSETVVAHAAKSLLQSE
ncbi:LysR family transcriptional regulator ArgP [Pseudoclavibacter sp. 13-3]|uniref:LysR family transcriptional regulator ArgP n=1 Tax=Pseudoclavibacter sp. 13-3 TaxID=2901228 RepID=UPI001E33E3AC|nr:LysR family transcriptional regulator ArgP [Pseudoclavibacter sp. 13-3]MCD7101496.1 LysR family transcriptional regulator ArgP [Pseudoclavibacter sp. 13-3]